MTPTTAAVGLRPGGLTWRLVGREVVLLDLASAKFFSLNCTGSVLWELLSKGATPATLSEELVRTYAVDRYRATEDVERFLTVLDSYDLLAWKHTPRSA